MAYLTFFHLCRPNCIYPFTVQYQSWISIASKFGALNRVCAKHQISDSSAGIVGIGDNVHITAAVMLVRNTYK